MKPLYEIDIAKIENIELEYQKLSGIELQSFLYQSCGITLLGIQKTEFIVQGIVSHFNQNLLQANKKFRNLTPRIFLDNNDNAKRRRKQTLGEILKFMAKTIVFFEYDEFSLYVESRNNFVHSFWRDFLTGRKINEGKELYKSIFFLTELLKLDIKWRYIFKGLLFEFAITAAERCNKKVSEFNYLKQYHNDFLYYINKKYVT